MAQAEIDNTAAGESYIFPTSFAQQRLWFLDELEPGGSAYNLPGALRLEGDLNVEALERSINEIVARHESLRTTFTSVEGKPLQVVSPFAPSELQVTRLGHLPAETREARLRQLVKDEGKRPFDLKTGPLLRASLVELGPRDHVLLFTMHHIVSDGWSKACSCARWRRSTKPSPPGGRRRSQSCPCSTPTTPSGSASGSKATRVEAAARLLARATGRAAARARFADRPAAPVRADATAARSVKGRAGRASWRKGSRRSPGARA